MRVAGLLVALLAAPSLAAPVQGPVAVMPFKNLNSDSTENNWMKVGIAETMVSDLKKRSKLTLVERDQVDKALAELLLQGAKPNEASTAAEVGKLIGAKTVVLGAFQQAGRKLRITARFISVETGEVLDTAKVTGPEAEVFLLQDQIVARLIGEPWKKPAPAQKLKRLAPPKRIKAYKLYAMAASTASDAERVGYLRESLEADPEFSYALEDLAELERKMAGYRKTANQVALTQEEQQLAVFEDTSKTPTERGTALITLLGQLQMKSKFRRVHGLTTGLLRGELPDYPHMDLREFIHQTAFTAALTLRRVDEALQLGEQFLARYPGSAHFRGVELQMQQLIDERRKVAEDKAQAEADLAQIERERAELLAEHRDERDSVPPMAQLRALDFRRCSTLASYGQSEGAIASCAEFVTEWKRDPDPSSAELVLNAQLLEAIHHWKLGRIDQARAIGERLKAEAPKFYKSSVASFMEWTWPAE